MGEANEVQAGLRQYETHLRELATAFNSHADVFGLPVHMDPESAIRAVRSGVGIARVAPFWSAEREDDSGIIHVSQLLTAIECIKYLRDDPKQCGHVVGAMQSGKTTTSLALQWAGPILYILTGKRAYPFYIIGNQRNHEDQTKFELERFLRYYGDIEFRPTGSGKHVGLDPVFDHSPSLNNYREHVLRGMKDFFEIQRLEDIVFRRVGGAQALSKIVDQCQRANAQGYRSLMIIDEPQFGASDRLVAREDGAAEQRQCVLAKIFDRIEQELGSTRKEHWFVGLSATPFELNDLRNVWEVRQKLTEAYSGINYFNGEPISPGVNVEPPMTLGLLEFAFHPQINVPFLADVSMSAYDKETAFEKHARKIGYGGTHDDFKHDVEVALRATIYNVIAFYGTEVVGLCIRAFNDNSKTRALMDRLALDPDRIEVLEYFGDEMGGCSVKRAISRRTRTDVPYLVLVTNRARMADAFPVNVRFFIDFAQKASDLNALLQGLLGRACGYNKRSIVVLSDVNASIVRDYVATRGGYVHKTSRHSVAVGGGLRRGAPTAMLKLRREMDDTIVQQFFQRIDQEIVANIPYAKEMKTSRAKKGQKFRTGPILRIAEELGLFDHVEQPSVRKTLFPEVVTGIEIARRDDKIQHSRDPKILLSYSLDSKGDCRYTFRHQPRDSAAKGGAAGRAMGAKDVGQHIEPTIYVEKFDQASGAVIESDEQAGHWRAFMVTFPLRKPVRELYPAQVAYPTRLSPYSDWMDDDEREVRDTAPRKRR